MMFIVRGTCAVWHSRQASLAGRSVTTQCSCACGLERIGEDVSEKLDYTPGVFEVERHMRGKWVCRRCERLIQAPVPPHVIDKGIPTAGLLAQVLIAKYLDHLPLYRQEQTSDARAWRYRARRWRSGSEPAAMDCSHWPRPLRQHS